MKRVVIIILAIIFISYPLTFSVAQGNRISLDIKGMDILDVLKILSMRSDLNIIAGRNVRGNVTMFLKDVDVWDAFEIILAANDLAYEKRGEIINVMTQRDYELLYGEKYRDRRIVKTIKLKHARVEDVSAALSQIKTNIGKVVADEPSKSIVLMDTPSKVGEMEEIIKTLDIPIVTKVYELQYATVEDIKDKITEMLTKNIGSLQIDERTNKIAITDTERKIPEFDKVIAAFDEKHKEVEIEAMILELTLNDEYQMGINWDVLLEKLSSVFSGKIGNSALGANFSELSSSVIPAQDKAQAGLAYRIGHLDTNGFQAVIQFLQTYGETKVLSNPRITVLNNEEAKILVGTNQPYVTTTVTGTGENPQTAANVTYLDLGVKLTVTPTINKDGFITMKVKPEVSSQAETPLTYTVGGDTNVIPIVTTSTTETTVMIKDNNTVMLSGLIQKRDEEEVNKVPALSDIPILGNLFKNTRRGSTSQPERKEIIIFLTPRITYGEDEKFTEEIKQEREETKQIQQAQKLISQRLKEEKEKALIDSRSTFSRGQVYPRFRGDGNGSKAKTIVWNEHMRPSDYYRLIWQRINERVIANKPKRLIPGEVLVSFVVASDGKLTRRPKIAALPETDPALVQIALDSVEEAAPFPSFPPTIEKQGESFNINISYE